ncbi:MAG: ferredoxin [Rickettsiales bacterium]|nr:ferredoxin [Rickettsiales bacterium]|tara:strand:- start:99 stop:326 length:228 start_codon:yes stop_codon:yes gene_type:complete
MTEFIYDENVKGSYYVNDDCIACDTCVDIACDFFKLTPDYDHAYVYNQPENKDDLKKCNEALDTCPVAAIGKYND